MRVDLTFEELTKAVLQDTEVKQVDTPMTGNKPGSED